MREPYLATKYLSTDGVTPMELAQWQSAAELNYPSHTDQKSNGAQFPEFRPMRYASSLFQPKGCFSDVKDANEQDFDNLYCVGNTMIMVLSFVNILLFTIVLVFHIKANL